MTSALDFASPIEALLRYRASEPAGQDTLSPDAGHCFDTAKLAGPVYTLPESLVFSYASILQTIVSKGPCLKVAPATEYNATGDTGTINPFIVCNNHTLLCGVVKRMFRSGPLSRAPRQFRDDDEELTFDTMFTQIVERYFKGSLISDAI